ncbi:hypothetical protein HanXRQr2_Chr16g0767081 [Helianthus annuus]|uniref:Uncharacterized protein n=1 Tax=Helianthus annuus TaxID=4232 RepID=A0A9K3DUF5_HELAN|nr:hypothetical protein HanXRQr2_Chr16g0767081 [Helianthus annuus]KAJ0822709.1 hypothetical protein HanPSC8_Chr16g0735281 [Helianthus annuus]
MRMSGVFTGISNLSLECIPWSLIMLLRRFIYLNGVVEGEASKSISAGQWVRNSETGKSVVISPEGRRGRIPNQALEFPGGHESPSVNLPVRSHRAPEGAYTSGTC